MSSDRERRKRNAPSSGDAIGAGEQQLKKGAKRGAGATAGSSGADGKDSDSKQAGASGSPMSDDGAAAATSAAASSSGAAAASASSGSAQPAGASSSAAAQPANKRAAGAKSIRASDQKRKKLVPRCSSPSHFLMENGDGPPSSSAPSFASPLPSALSSDPSAPASTKVAESSARIDGFLRSVGTMYYRNHMSLTKENQASGAAGAAADVWVSSDYDKLEYPTLDLLLSPLRKSNVLDDWCPREIALFESGICAVGKDFHAIANLIVSKNCKECVDFYYVWKKSSHYALWKNFGKPSKKPHANKEEQWKQVREQMNAGSGAAAAASAAAAATGGAASAKKEA